MTSEPRDITPEEDTMLDTRETHATVILEKRWDGKPYGFVAKYDGQNHRRTTEGWLRTNLRSDDIIHRLEDASGLWKSDAAKNIGMALVIEAVLDARDEARKRASAMTSEPRDITLAEPLSAEEVTDMQARATSDTASIVVAREDWHRLLATAARRSLPMTLPEPDAVEAAWTALWDQHEDGADICGFNRETFDKHRRAIEAAIRATPSTEPRPRACVCHYADPDGVIAHLLAEYDRATPSTVEAVAVTFPDGATNEERRAIADKAGRLIGTVRATSSTDLDVDRLARALWDTLYPDPSARIASDDAAAIAARYRALGDRKGEDDGA